MQTVERARPGLFGWHFIHHNGRMANDAGPTASAGETEHIVGRPNPCHWGLHFSPTIVEAMSYAFDSSSSDLRLLRFVQGRGFIRTHRRDWHLLTAEYSNRVDKLACSDRYIVAGPVDVRPLLARCIVEVGLGKGIAVFNTVSKP